MASLKGPDTRIWWGIAFVIFSVAAAFMVTPSWPVWFWYHPAAMLLGYVAFMGNGVLVKKIAGKTNTKIHGWLMTIGTVAAVFGWYVIYSNKEASGKKHITTWHGLLGVISLLGTCSSAVGGFVGLHPDFGLMTKSKWIRLIHRYDGIAMVVLAFVVCVMGWATVQKQEVMPVMLFGAPLALFAWALV